MLNSIATARAAFFNEGDFAKPLRFLDWRGAVLDPDLFNGTRIDQRLWIALAEVAEVAEVRICGYFSGADGCKDVEAEWGEFSKFMLARENRSPEFLIFDSSQRWVVWGESDVTTVALDSELADLVDSALSIDGISLRSVTEESFSVDAIASDTTGGQYIRGVLGAQSRSDS